MSLHLSKSGYCSAVQCPKMLWLKQNRLEEFDESVINQTVLDNGNMVGDLAMGLFGDFIEVPFGDLKQMLSETDRLMKNGTPVIAEASFSYEGNFCSIDILKNHRNGQVEIYEVKSSTEIHEIYYHDVAYQTYVLKKLGYDVIGCYLVHINRDYVRYGELELQKLFMICDLTDKVMPMLLDVEKRIADLEIYMKQEEEPDDGIGEQCFKPYPCGFFKYCTRMCPSPNVFDLSGMQNRTKLKYYAQGKISFHDLEGQKLNAGCLLQIDHELHEVPDHIEKEKIEEFLNKLSYPLYFLDFETFQPAVPLYDNSTPYEQIVFQYSLHYIEKVGGELKHIEYLAYPGKDPRRKLGEALCKDIPENVCVLAYNMGFEKGRIKSLAGLYPDLHDHLMNIHDHIEDLMIPFRQKDYYTRAMKGSYSIKYVLPALFPDDPELDYHNLEEVHNGTEASATFAQMTEMTPEQLEISRKNLLKYCGLDTYAMVKTWEKLQLLESD